MSENEMAKRGEKNPCLWIGVRKYIAPTYMQTNQHHYQKRTVVVPYCVESRSRYRSMCECACFCGYIYTWTSVLYRIPHSQCFRHSYHQQFLCGLLLYTLFSTFLLLVFVLLFYMLRSFPVAEWFWLSYFTFSTLGILFSFFWRSFDCFVCMCLELECG